MEKERLFNEFPPVTAEEWKEKIVEDLKGADYEKKMIWKTQLICHPASALVKSIAITI